jgi:outer membrane protein TolC
MKRIAPYLIALAGFAQPPAPLSLSLDEAVEIALAPDGAARVRLAGELIAQAEARRRLARGALLPGVDGAFTYQNFTRNLQTFGLQISAPIPGFSIPSFVGPVDVLDFRATASWNFFDLSAIRRYQSARTAVAAVRAERDAAVAQTRAQVARLYAAALRAEAAETAAQANVDLAARILRLAQSQKEAGTGTGIDITRAEVQQSAERQRLLTAAEDRAVAHLQLLRAIGLALDGTVQLTDRLAWDAAPPPEPAAALTTARENRPELRAQSLRTESARLQYSSLRAERLPSAAAFSDYGTTGTAMDHLLPTRSTGISVKIPIWDGGRRAARRAEAFSGLRQEEIRERDTARQVELEVRTAVENLKASTGQVQLTREALALAQRELEQAQRRYEAGVASGVEVTDAQTRLARARESEVAALARWRVSRIALDTATGLIR